MRFSWEHSVLPYLMAASARHAIAPPWSRLNLPYLCVHAVTYDDSIRVELTAKRITPHVTDGYGEVCWDAVLYNQEDEIVATYDILPLVEKVNTTYA